MTENASFNDQPIENPEADRYGIAPFAQALAKSIEKMQAPIGAVLAIHGAWGSGKSSAINLIRHYLREDKAEDKAEVEIVDFNCWWFRGEEALTLAFFRELAVTMGGALGKDGKKKTEKIGEIRPLPRPRCWKSPGFTWWRWRWRVLGTNSGIFLVAF